MTRAEWDKQSASGAAASRRAKPPARTLSSSPRCSSIISISSMARPGNEATAGCGSWTRCAGNPSRWEAYHRDFAAFLKKQDEFLKLPGVKKIDGGRIRVSLQSHAAAAADTARGRGSATTTTRRRSSISVCFSTGATEADGGAGNGRQVCGNRPQDRFSSNRSVQVQDRADDGEIDHHARDVHGRCQRRRGHDGGIQIDRPRADRQQRAKHGGG